MNKNSILKTSDEYPEVRQADFDRAIRRQGLKPAENYQRRAGHHQPRPLTVL